MRLSLVAAALLVTSPALAWTRREVATDAAPTTVRGKLDGDTAVFTVRYVLSVEAATYEESFAGLELPNLGVVTAATVTARGTSRSLGLVPAAGASSKFQALDGADGPTPGRDKTNAVMIQGSTGRADVGIAMAHAGQVALEVTVSAPTCFYRDARYVSVPARWRAVAEAALRKTPVDDSALEAACSAVVDTGAEGPRTWIGFPAREVASRPSGERIVASAGRLVIDDQHHFTRLELSVAGKLADVPADLATVVLVDASRSMTAEELETQRQLVGSYLRVAPASRVQVLAYARRTTALLPGWTNATQAAVRVERELRGLAPRNGSNFDTALAAAASWLGRVEGTRRIVLFTDERMANRLEAIGPASLRRLLPPGTLVHVVTVDRTMKELRRDEDAKLAALASATDGMSVRVGPLDDNALHDATRLARPISIDQIKLDAPGWNDLQTDGTAKCDGDESGTLAEGSSCTWWGEGDTASGPLVIEGLVWGKRVQRVVRPDPNRARELAREVSGRATLSEEIQDRVDEIARAVNPRWALYAEWGGSAKYEGRLGFGLSGGGTSCACDHLIGSIGHPTTILGVVPPPDLASQLRPLIAACGVDDDHISVGLELTFLEIVDVNVTITRNVPVEGALARKQQACVEDAVWDATPSLPRPLPHDSFNVLLPPKR